jgi:tetratricopeptide (TPR) repeat protein
MKPHGSQPHGSDGWVDDLTEVCAQFQLDLSCLVDGELDEVAGARAIAHLEDCDACRTFFDDVRDQVRAHRELARPEGLLASYAALLGSGGFAELEATGLVQRLATVFYQLGKAYVLAGTDPGFRVRVFEKAAQIASLQTRGRGFVDGVLASGRGETGGIDWSEARHLLNGRLERIESPLEKGRRLLEEAVASDPGHEEARIYLAWLDAHEGRRIRAARSFRQIFRSSIDDANRAHAAVQLGKLLAEEGETRKALACNRWIVSSGLADRDPRFFVARFNIGLYYADLRRPADCLRAFRELLDRHPERAGEVAELFARSPKTRALIDRQPGLAEALVRTCPELFVQPDGTAPVSAGDEVTS